MGKRHREVIAAKFFKGIIEEPTLAVRKMWDRWNFDIGEGRAERNYKRDQQMKREMQSEIKALR